MNSATTRNLVLTIAALALLAAPALSLAAATIVINNNDGAGEGFNDPTPVAPVGGNPGTTLGAQRLYAFSFAVNLIGVYLESNMPVTVDAVMNPLTCTASSAVLGSAGTITVHRDFLGAPLSLTWYPQALANSHANTDLNPGTADINANFNSSINGSPSCLGGYSWYYGVDANPPAQTIDFVSVVLHEVMHGLGFQTFVNASTGIPFQNLDDTYMVNLRRIGASPAEYEDMSDAQRSTANRSDPNLVWDGSRVVSEAPWSSGTNAGFPRIHAPSSLQLGSSVSHWTTDAFPNEIMEPAYTAANHSPGLALYLMSDIGWVLDESIVAVAISHFEVANVGGTVEVSARYASTTPEVRVNVYRAQGDGAWETIHSEVRPGLGDFRYLDRTAVPGRSYRYRVGIADVDGEFMSIERQVDLPSLVAHLAQNVPNPFNPTTSIEFVLPEQQRVQLRVFDAGGHLVRTLLDDVRGIGTHTVEWNGTDDNGNRVGSGIYFYRLDAGRVVESRKMVLLK